MEVKIDMSRGDAGALLQRLQDFLSTDKARRIEVTVYVSDPHLSLVAMGTLTQGKPE